MRTFPLFILCLFGIVAPMSAQKAEMEMLTVTRNDSDEVGLADWLTNVTLRVFPEGEGKYRKVDLKKSAIAEATNPSTGQPIKVKAIFNEYVTDLSDGVLNTMVSFAADRELERSWVKVTGVIAFETIAETEKHKARIVFTEGARVKAGDLKLVVKEPKAQDGGRLFTLECAGSMDAIVDIRFTDAGGVPVEVSRVGSSRTTSNETVTEESWTFHCPVVHDGLEAEFHFAKRIKTKEVPFDVLVPVNP